MDIAMFGEPEYGIGRAMEVKMMKVLPVLMNRYEECRDGHREADKDENKCLHCYRSLDYDLGGEDGLDTIKRREESSGLRALVKEKNPDFYERYLRNLLKKRRVKVNTI